MLEQDLDAGPSDIARRDRAKEEEEAAVHAAAEHFEVEGPQEPHQARTKPPSAREVVDDILGDAP